MGGLGSGRGPRRSARRSKKGYIDNLPSLNIPKVIRIHKDSPNGEFVSGDILLKVKPTSIHLQYGKKDSLVIFKIKICALSCHYGGYRYYGLCPVCQRRVISLYINSKNTMICRLCLDLVYLSQNATFSYRLYKKMKAVKEKLNSNEWSKPKWMREKTYKQLRSNLFALDEKQQIADFFSLRNYQSVNKIFNKYGCAIIAAEILGPYPQGCA